MSDEWQYQIRLQMDEAHAESARAEVDHPELKPVFEILTRHNATLKSQYDAFAGYVAEAEANGVENYHLYEWTKATIENPAKERKYKQAFTVYVDGNEVYDKAAADAIEAELTPLIGGNVVKSIAKHDTNPANNPQMPAKYRK